MTTFTIDTDNNIRAFPGADQAEATASAGVQTFTSQKELAQLAAAWPVTRLADTWNGFAGIAPFGHLKPVKRFTDRNSAVSRIWQAIQKLAPPPEDAPVAQQGAHVAPVSAAATESATPQPERPKAPKTTKRAKGMAAGKSARAKKAKVASTELREGSKKARVLALIERAKGATLSEIMDKMGWQKHTVRGFMAGAMKKAGFTVESFKPEGGERTYRIHR
jgi:hypothetical protein